MQIELLYFEGCPAREPTRENIYAALAALGLTADVSEIDVLTEDHARRLSFKGSPTVRVDGEDIEIISSTQPDGRRCRLYVSRSGAVGAIPDRALIRQALLGQRTPALAAAAVPSASDVDCCAAQGSQPTHSARVQLLTASWCPRCPEARRFWRDTRDRLMASGRELLLEEVDIESAAGRQLAQQHGIRAVPTTLINGELVRLVSAADRTSARRRVERAVGGDDS